jgi:hypothetical protein
MTNGADTTGKETGRESSLSSWVGPYVTDMLGKGKAIASQPYQAYQGPLTAGASNLQQQAFQGLAGLAAPVTGAFNATAAQNYMNPYLSAALRPQLAEMRRQSEISGLADTSRLTKAGAYGGTRQAVMDAERDRSLQANIGRAAGEGYARAFDKAADLFGKDRAYGLDALGAQTKAGAIERGIEQEGIAADKAQFEEERDYPYRQVQYMQSLLKGLPIAAQSYNYAQPSGLSNLIGSGGILELLKEMFGGGGSGGSSGGGGGDDVAETVEDATGASDESIVDAENAGTVVV